MKRCFVTLALVTACHGEPSIDDPLAVLARVREQGHAVDVSLASGAVRYLGFTADPTVAQPGDDTTVTDYWLSVKPLNEDYDVFTHVLVEGASGWVPNVDYTPSPKTSAWRPGQVIAVKHTIKLPAPIPAITIELRKGMFAGKDRLTIDDAAADDGARRIRAGRIAVKGTPKPLPLCEALKTTTPPKIDGDLTDWPSTDTIDGFTLSRGNAPSRWRTAVKLAWDDTNLYVGFNVVDPDIRATLRDHDQPIYKEEAVEMFIDAKGDGDTYIELQSSPLGVTFDSVFHGGPRRNMDVHYDADFQAMCAVHGTIEDANDKDQGWACEWRVGLASIPGVTLPITSDSRWRVNFLRIAKDSQGDRLISDESAWSPPLMGDFHNLERFGTLAFRPPVGDAGTLR